MSKSETTWESELMFLTSIVAGGQNSIHCTEISGKEVGVVQVYIFA